MAITRIAPKSAYLLLEAQPARKTISTLVLEIASTNSTPTSKSASVMLGPKGITPQTRMAGTNTRTGGRKKSALSAARGANSSLRISFMASATGWKRPRGPTRLGP